MTLTPLNSTVKAGADQCATLTIIWSTVKLRNSNLNSSTPSIRLFNAEVSKLRFFATIKERKSPNLTSNSGSCVSHGRSRDVNFLWIKPLKNIFGESWFLSVVCCYLCMLSSRHCCYCSGFGQNSEGPQAFLTSNCQWFS